MADRILWRLDEGSGAKATAEGAALEGQLKGFDESAGWTSDARCPPGAIALDGVAQHILVPSSTLLDVAADGALTVAIWFKTSTPTGTDRLVSRYAEDGYHAGFDLLLTDFSGTDNFPTFYVLDDESHFAQAQGAMTRPAVADGQWHHLAAVVQRSDSMVTVALFFDGHRQGTGSAVTMSSVAPAYPLVFGARSYISGPGTHFFEGIIDHVTVVKHALSEARIEALASGPCVCY